jgi:WhiB family transcriptional regulator, redox-sensing transcriptional regulator
VRWEHATGNGIRRIIGGTDLRQESLAGFLRRRPDHEKEANVLDTTWMAQGECRDLPPETFFPTNGAGVEIAKRVCAECPVREACLEYALFHNIEHGVWGGESERARRRMARHRRSPQDSPI